MNNEDDKWQVLNTQQHHSLGLVLIGNLQQLQDDLNLLKGHTQSKLVYRLLSTERLKVIVDKDNIRINQNGGG